eukprot:6186966-Pleurochrysis_carterae.AAC.3
MSAGGAQPGAAPLFGVQEVDDVADVVEPWRGRLAQIDGEREFAGRGEELVAHGAAELPCQEGNGGRVFASQELVHLRKL